MYVAGYLKRRELLPKPEARRELCSSISDERSLKCETLVLHWVRITGVC